MSEFRSVLGTRAYSRRYHGDKTLVPLILRSIMGVEVEGIGNEGYSRNDKKKKDETDLRIGS